MPPPTRNLLVTVLTERLHDRLNHTFVEESSASKIACAFGTHSNISVGFTRSTVLNFPRRGQAETLFRALVGFHFV